MFYRKSVFEENGYDIPTNLDEFTQLVAEATGSEIQSAPLPGEGRHAQRHALGDRARARQVTQAGRAALARPAAGIRPALP